MRAYQVKIGENSLIYMPAGLVDEYWHAMEHDPSFKEEVRAATGADFDHENDYDQYPELQGEGELTWVTTYEKLFGPLNQIWFYQADGALDEEAAGRYNREGIFRMSWKCGPKIKPVTPEDERRPETTAQCPFLAVA